MLRCEDAFCPTPTRVTQVRRCSHGRDHGPDDTTRLLALMRNWPTPTGIDPTKMLRGSSRSLDSSRSGSKFAGGSAPIHVVPSAIGKAPEQTFAVESPDGAGGALRDVQATPGSGRLWLYQPNGKTGWNAVRPLRSVPHAIADIPVAERVDSLNLFIVGQWSIMRPGFAQKQFSTLLTTRLSFSYDKCHNFNLEKVLPKAVGFTTEVKRYRHTLD